MLKDNLSAAAGSAWALSMFVRLSVMTDNRTLTTASIYRAVAVDVPLFLFLTSAFLLLVRSGWEFVLPPRSFAVVSAFRLWGGDPRVSAIQPLIPTRPWPPVRCPCICWSEGVPQIWIWFAAKSDPWGQLRGAPKPPRPFQTKPRALPNQSTILSRSKPNATLEPRELKVLRVVSNPKPSRNHIPSTLNPNFKPQESRAFRARYSPTPIPKTEPNAEDQTSIRPNQTEVNVDIIGRPSQQVCSVSMRSERRERHSQKRWCETGGWDGDGKAGRWVVNSRKWREGG